MATGDQRGFFAGLTDEQRASALMYRGPENHGCYEEVMLRLVEQAQELDMGYESGHSAFTPIGVWSKTGA